MLRRACGGAMRILAFVVEPAVIRKILAHLENRGGQPGRGPPSGVATPSPLAS
ncbi:MAG TPA: hypothetical protein VMS86_08470 [Thermoanaerobaculia bacterium]|nr:hypothetical protein [Thermoanaerobaculia bacterium]